MDKPNLDFDSFFGPDEMDGTRVSGVLKRMKSDENLDLIFENITNRRRKRVLGVIAGLAILVFALTWISNE